MNALDFGIILAILLVLTFHRKTSFMFYLLLSAGFLGGYVLGLGLASHLVHSMESDLKKGLVSLACVFGLAAILALVGLFIGQKLRMRVIVSPLFKLDKVLAWPFKIFVCFAIVVLLAQTLIYIPILALQFEAQGSSVFMIANKFAPSLSVAKQAGKIAPNQFRDIRLAYDPNPITYDSLAKSGEFQTMLTRVAPSIVKVSGAGCTNKYTGSGFVVAPNMVVTNAHVIGGVSTIYIRDHAGSYPATPIVVDEDHDLAMLYSKFINGAPIPVAAEAAPLESKAVSTGYPYGGDLQIVPGVISEQTLKSDTRKLDGTNTLGLNASLGPGSSGGPIFNEAGEVVGVNDAARGNSLIGVRAELVTALLHKAKGRFIPTSTHLCASPPVFY